MPHWTQREGWINDFIEEVRLEHHLQEEALFDARFSACFGWGMALLVALYSIVSR